MKVFQGIGACIASAGVAVLLVIPQLALAQANRTWVSGSGDDMNQCTRSAPCKTFAVALGKTNTNGEIDCIDAGDYGKVNIQKGIVIDCRGSLGGVQATVSAYAFSVNAPGAVVVLRNLVIDGVGSGLAGIHITAAAAVDVEDVTIRAMTNSGIEFVPSTGMGASQLALVRVTSRDNAQHGLLVSPTPGFQANVTIFDSTFAANTLTGMRVNDFGFAAVTNTVFSGNGTHGVAVVASTGMGPPKVSLDRVTTSTNANGGVLASGSGAAIYLSNVLSTGNAYGLYPAIGGGAYVSFGNNRTTGNTIGDGMPTSILSQF